MSLLALTLGRWRLPARSIAFSMVGAGRGVDSQIIGEVVSQPCHYVEILTMSFPPEAFLIGAEKAGTTMLLHLFDQHPGITVSEPRITDYFTSNWDKGLDWYRACFVGPPESVFLDAAGKDVVFVVRVVHVVVRVYRY